MYNSVRALLRIKGKPSTDKLLLSTLGVTGDRLGELISTGELGQVMTSLKHLVVEKVDKVIRWLVLDRFNGYKDKRSCVCGEAISTTLHILNCSSLVPIFNQEEAS